MSSTTTTTTNAPGGMGTVTGALQSITSYRIPLPIIGGVSAGTALLGIGILYFAFFRKKGQKVAIVRV